MLRPVEDGSSKSGRQLGRGAGGEAALTSAMAGEGVGRAAGDGAALASEMAGEGVAGSSGRGEDASAVAAVDWVGRGDDVPRRKRRQRGRSEKGRKQR